MLRWLCLVAIAAQLAVSDRVTLLIATHAIDGELQLLQDARVTPSMQKKLWGTGDAPADLAHAALRLTRRDGTLADSSELERPLARLEHTRLYGNRESRRETYLVTVDYSAGAGSYAGPITSFVEVTNGRLKWLDATDSKSGASERITVMRSLKTIWQIVPARDGSGQDILEARCRPAFEAQTNTNDAQFVLSYFRYSFDGKQWVRRVREEKGFSEFEDGFPDRRLFP